MAKVYFDADIEGISGRLDKKKTACYARNKKTGKCYRYEYSKERKDANSESQQTVRTAFKAKAQAASAWWAANKPATDDATPTAEWTAMMKAYDAQNKYGNPYCFVRAKVNSDNTVSFVTTASSTDTNTNTNTGGTTSGGGTTTGGGGDDGDE